MNLTGKSWVCYQDPTAQNPKITEIAFEVDSRGYVRVNAEFFDSLMRAIDYAKVAEDRKGKNVWPVYDH